MKNIPDVLTIPSLTVAHAGAALKLLEQCRQFGRRGLIIHGRSLHATGMLNAIIANGPADVITAVWKHKGGEPTLQQLEELLSVARETRPDWVAGVGGGSVLDLAKACAGLLEAPLPVAAYHEGAEPMPARVPFIAVPTTAGTGSEATGVCVFTNSITGSKKSFRHPTFIARQVILDHELLRSCPPPVIASAGLDAFTQAVESFVSNGATWFSDQLSLEATVHIARNLPAVYAGARGEQARHLLYGSYLAGVALANARLGIVHGLAHPLGVRYGVPHGVVCAVCLPYALEFNRPVCSEKYALLDRELGDDILTITRELLQRLEVRSPFWGRPVHDRAWIIKETMASGSTAANPRKVTAEDVENLLDKIFGPPQSV